MLYVAGQVNARVIQSHKRLQSYDLADYNLLLNIVSQHQKLVLTPNTMTEASNLLSQIADPFRTDLRQGLKTVAETGLEIAVPSHEAMLDIDYRWLGLTDAAILTVLQRHTVQGQVAVLTTDLSLYRAASARGLRAANFEHLRD